MSRNAIINFPLLTKEDWKVVVEKELRGDSFDSIMFVIDGIAFDPYYDASYMEGETGVLPKRTNDVGLGEYFDFRAGLNPLKNLQEGLMQGLTSPVILVDGHTDVLIFSGIQFDILTPWFVLDSPDDLAFIEDIKKRFDTKWQPSWTILGGDDFDHRAGYFKSFSFDTQTDVGDFIKDFLAKLDTFDHEQLGRIALTMKLSTHLVHDIVKARAIKIAWCNYLIHRKVDTTPYVVFATWESGSDFPGYIIDYAYQMLAATMAQADYVILPEAAKVTDEDRTSRNVGQVGLVEGELDRHTDPVAGSYFIEYVATRLALHGWDAYLHQV